MMLSNHHLSLVCIVLAIIGLTALVVVEEANKPVEAKLSNLDNLEGQWVKVRATASSVFTTKSGTVLLTLKDGPFKVKGVIFPNTNVKLYSGQEYYLVGTVERYKGELELVVEGVDE